MTEFDTFLIESLPVVLKANATGDLTMLYGPRAYALGRRIEAVRTLLADLAEDVMLHQQTAKGSSDAIAVELRQANNKFLGLDQLFV